MTRSFLVRLLLVVLVVLGLPVALAGEALAEEGCVAISDPITHNVIGYECAEVTQTELPGHQGTSAPPCDLVSPATFCQGTQACYVKDVVTPYAPPRSPPPTPDADWHVVMCTGTSLNGWTGTAVWDGTTPQPPTLQEQAVTAFGQLRAPGGTLEFNPPGRTVVTIPTWFWAVGPTNAELTGSSAFGLVAIAFDPKLNVTAGDGSESFACDLAAPSDACSHAYRRSSARASARSAGRPAYPASAQIRWKVRFELGGRIINIPAAPTVLDGPRMNTAVVVDEIQTTVVG